MRGQISLFDILPQMVLKKSDREYGWIYLCPTCKSFICSGSKCFECGQLVKWPDLRIEKLTK